MSQMINAYWKLSMMKDLPSLEKKCYYLFCWMFYLWDEIKRLPIIVKANHVAAIWRRVAHCLRASKLCS